MKKIIIVTIILLVMLVLIPISSKMKDGGTTHYNAIFYDVYDMHRVTTPDDYNDAIVGNEYIEGTIIKILGFEVYNNTNPHIEV